MTSWSKVFGVLLTATAALVSGCQEPAKSPADNKGSGGGGDHAEVGKPAPELSVQTLNDKGKIDLSAMQGKVVVVDFWATWCGPCKQSFPKLEAMSKKVSDKVVIVGVSVDDEKKGIVEFAKENGASFAIGWDEGHSIANRWKVGTMPTTFIVDASGKVRHIHDGYHDGETDVMEKELNALVSEAGSSGGGDTKAKGGDDAKGSDAKGSDSKGGDSKGGDKGTDSKGGDSKGGDDKAGDKGGDAKGGDDNTSEDPKPKKPKGKKPKGKGKGKKPAASAPAR